MRYKGQYIRGGLHCSKILHEVYLTPAIIFETNTTPATWDGDDKYFHTRLIGLRCKFVLWESFICFLFRGSQTEKPESAWTKIMRANVDWTGSLTSPQTHR